MEGGRKVILFDGICNLCDGFVNFVFARDSQRKFFFAPLQSTVGRAYVSKYGLSNDLKTIVFVDETQDICLTHSSAVLTVLSGLNLPWSSLYYCIYIPQFIRDFCYGVVAANRYRIFGKSKEQCAYKPGLRKQFLDIYDASKETDLEEIKEI